MGKVLLAFFGELRTFEYVLPRLKNLDTPRVDIVVSTWSTSSRGTSKFEVTEKLIKKLLPKVKQIHITDSTPGNIIPKIINKHQRNTYKLFYHWKKIINNLENPNDYDNVIFHRCDLISNWNVILDGPELDANTIYLHTTKDLYAPTKKHPTAHWCNDYYFYGDVTIVNKFVNSFKEDSMDSHHAIFQVLYDNNIKYKTHILRGTLYRDMDLIGIETFSPCDELNYISK